MPDTPDAFARRHGLGAEATLELHTLWDASSNVEPPGPDSPTLDEAETPWHEGLFEGHRAARYEDLGPLDAGGMGEVRTVRDLWFDRILAMKVIQPHLAGNDTQIERFVREAQLTAQLQHPGIVPVHDLGRLEDGRVWFTMRQVHGRTLSDVIDEHHTAPATTSWTLRRLMQVFQAVCQTVAFAHEHGVVHRDLKPDNLMVGPHGVVYVLDWGLACLGNGVEPAVLPSLGHHATVPTARPGKVTGTPLYMAPEQARSDAEAIGPHTDVYALGATLYQLLSGRPPYVGEPKAVLQALRAGRPPVPLRDALGTLDLDLDLGPSRAPGDAPTDIPVALADACHRAMAMAPEERFSSANALADAIGHWLDGRDRRDRALRAVEQALAKAERERALLDAVPEKRDIATKKRSEIAPWQDENDKLAAWRAEDELRELERRARRLRLEVDQALTAALQLDPTLPEAHETLARRYQERHRSAEAKRDVAATEDLQALVAHHARALPPSTPAREQLFRYLEGSGRLSLRTHPPDARVWLRPYAVRRRRLVLGSPRDLGTEPLTDLELPMGSYLCEIEHPGRATVRYPIVIRREGHWHAVPPGGSEPEPVWLPPAGSLGPDEIYIPAGWFRAGDDTLPNHPQQDLWCHGFVINRFSVTNREYIVFLDDLVANGHVDAALRHAPRNRPGREGELGNLIFGFDGRHFYLVADAEGDIWQPDWPVFHVDWHSANAYLAWRAERTGTPWRLPAELEWEKAARGVDGRTYPWGDHFDPSWCRMVESQRGADHGDFGPESIHSYPVDTSCYDVRGLAGNIHDWCLDRYEPLPVTEGGRVVVPEVASYAGAPGFRATRGGTWTSNRRSCKCAARFLIDVSYGASVRGFRGAYSLGPHR